MTPKRYTPSFLAALARLVRESERQRTCADRNCGGCERCRPHLTREAKG